MISKEFCKPKKESYAKPSDGKFTLTGLRFDSINAVETSITDSLDNIVISDEDLLLIGGVDDPYDFKTPLIKETGLHFQSALKGLEKLKLDRHSEYIEPLLTRNSYQRPDESSDDKRKRFVSRSEINISTSSSPKIKGKRMLDGATTPLGEINLSVVGIPPVETFMDRTVQRRIYCGMVDHKDNKELSFSPGLSCYYDTYEISKTMLIGMPISFDESTREFKTDMVFCSIECLNSYYDERLSDIDKDGTYRNTLPLIGLMYKFLFNEVPQTFRKAHDWRLLKKFGGPMEIVEYRKTLSKICFKDLQQYKCPIKQKPAIPLFNEMEIRGDI